MLAPTLGGVWPGHLLLLMASGAVASAGLIWLLHPLLRRYALARPSARGLHTAPTPQGGGIAVLVACAGTALVGAWLSVIGPDQMKALAVVLAAAFGLAAVGMIDDIHPLPASPRLALQFAFMAVGVFMLPDGTRVLPMLPYPAEVVLLIVAGTWFINLTNFMDGLDWITVADTGPVSAALAWFWMTGDLPAIAGLPMIGLCAGLIGYAPFNKPVARLFLGDVGSLPIGFLLAYGLFSLAGHHGGSSGALIAAILLPLYPIADSGITLFRRLLQGQRVWEPHRSHFYQTAVVRGMTVWAVLSWAAGVNAVLAGLAWLSLNGRGSIQIMAALAGLGAVAATLIALSRRPREPRGSGERDA